MRCDSCQTNKPVAICSNCLFAHYCGAECQKQHWEEHKTKCQDFFRTGMQIFFIQGSEDEESRKRPREEDEMEQEFQENQVYARWEKLPVAIWMNQILPRIPDEQVLGMRTMNKEWKRIIDETFIIKAQAWMPGEFTRDEALRFYMFYLKLKRQVKEEVFRRVGYPRSDWDDLILKKDIEKIFQISSPYFNSKLKLFGADASNVEKVLTRWYFYEKEAHPDMRPLDALLKYRHGLMAKRQQKKDSEEKRARERVMMQEQDDELFAEMFLYPHNLVNVLNDRVWKTLPFQRYPPEIKTRAEFVRYKRLNVRKDDWASDNAIINRIGLLKTSLASNPMPELFLDPTRLIDAQSLKETSKELLKTIGRCTGLFIPSHIMRPLIHSSTYLGLSGFPMEWDLDQDRLCAYTNTAQENVNFLNILDARARILDSVVRETWPAYTWPEFWKAMGNSPNLKIIIEYLRTSTIPTLLDVTEQVKNVALEAMRVYFQRSETLSSPKAIEFSKQYLTPWNIVGLDGIQAFKDKYPLLRKEIKQHFEQLLSTFDYPLTNTKPLSALARILLFVIDFPKYKDDLILDPTLPLLTMKSLQDNGKKNSQLFYPQLGILTPFEAEMKRGGLSVITVLAPLKPYVPEVHYNLIYDYNREVFDRFRERLNQVYGGLSILYSREGFWYQLDVKYREKDVRATRLVNYIFDLSKTVPLDDDVEEMMKDFY